MMTRLLIDRDALAGARLVGQRSEVGGQVLEYTHGRALIVCHRLTLSELVNWVVEASISQDRAEQGQVGEEHIGKKRRRIELFARSYEKRYDTSLSQVLRELLPEEVAPPSPRPPSQSTARIRYTQCQLAECGKPLTNEQQRNYRRYCCIQHANQAPGKRQAMSRFNEARWREWKAQLSVPPTHTDEARARRSASRSKANLQRWRIWKSEGITPPTHTDEANQARRVAALRHHLGLNESDALLELVPAHPRRHA